jgi:hypothetical protein
MCFGVEGGYHYGGHELAIIGAVQPTTTQARPAGTRQGQAGTVLRFAGFADQLK